jgi:hypothetical protein
MAQAPDFIGGERFWQEQKQQKRSKMFASFWQT